MTNQAVAVLPARGGSKRIPRKNIRELDGHPLLWWAVRTCVDSGLFDDVVVSTDDDEIAAVARAAGASVPFNRSEDLSDDHASTVDVIADAVGRLRSDGQPLDLACCVYPASVFLGADELRGARDLLLATPDADYSAIVCAYPHPVQRALALDGAGRVSFASPEYAGSRTQDLEPRWHDAGQFYWGRATAWLERRPILPNAVGYVVEASRVCDIDTEDDWRRAEVLHRLRLG